MEIKKKQFEILSELFESNKEREAKLFAMRSYGDEKENVYKPKAQECHNILLRYELSDLAEQAQDWAESIKPKIFVEDEKSLTDRIGSDISGALKRYSDDQTITQAVSTILQQIEYTALYGNKPNFQERLERLRNLCNGSKIDGLSQSDSDKILPALKRILNEIEDRGIIIGKK